MDITQLKYFITVCSFNHMTLAANQLFISQSALSKHIKELEAEIGVKLFDRTGRTLHLTTAGLDFLTFAEDVVARHDRVLQKIQTYLQQKSSHLTLGVIPVLSQYKIHQDILAFEKEHPDIALQIFEDKGDQILKLLDDELVELAIVRTATLPNDAYKAIPLTEDQLVLVTAAAHPLASRKNIGLKDLCQENFIMLDTGNGLHNLCLTACRHAGFKPTIRYHFTRIETILGFVRENAGVTLLMKNVVQAFPQNGLACLDITDNVRSQIALVFPHGRHLSPSAILFQLALMKHLPPTRA